jgi:hypothetical protein
MVGWGAALFVAPWVVAPAWAWPLTSVAHGLLQLAGVARFSDQLQRQEPGAWIWLALLVNAILSVGHVGGMADENDPGRDLAAMAPAPVLGEAGPP